MPIAPSPAVLRACDLLEHLARRPHQAFSVSELAREVGIPRATCDAVLLALAERSLVDRREPDLRYTLGPACIALGDAARDAGSVLVRVGPLAEGLARDTGTCVALTTMSGAELRVERVFDHGPPFGAHARAGESVPLVAPFGAVFVAWAAESEFGRWLDEGDIHDPEERRRYAAALATVRSRGYSVTLASGRADVSGILEQLRAGQREPSARRDAAIRELTRSEYLPVDLERDTLTRVSQMSAPVFDHTGKVVVQVMVLGPASDLTRDEIDALADRLLSVARQATERIGGSAKPER